MNPADTDFDQRHIWHPYSTLIDRAEMYPVQQTEGCQIVLSDGRRLVDGMASWWSVIHGYNHATLTAAGRRQLESMPHIMFGGLTHQPAIDLCRTLVEMTATELETVFLSDSGSVSVEVAIKMAIQFWYSLGKPKKQRLLTVRGGYHGDTFAAMSICDPDKGMHSTFQGILPKQFFAPAPRITFDEPWQEDDITELAKQLEHHHSEIAAVILEPIVQGAGGMRFYSPHYLTELRTLCDRFGVLLIFDEIATGFGRTGKLFAYGHSNVVPDILCVGKALTGGYLSLAATLTSRQIADGISQLGKGVFMHGPTFMGNPLATAIANASLGILQTGRWQMDVDRIERGLTIGLADCRNDASVKDVRVLGAIGVVELHQPVDMRTVQPRFVDLGVWVRPFGNLIYTMPPYIISDQELQQVVDAIATVVAELP